MQILSRYLLARFLRSFAMILVVLFLAVLVGDVLLDLGDLLQQQKQVGLRAALAALVLETPARYLPLLVPVASFAASFFTLGLAAHWRELTAMKAGGISPLRVVLPLLSAGAALSAVSLLLNETVVLRSARAIERYDADGADDFALRRGSFWHHSGSVIYSVRESDPSTRTLSGVTVLELTANGRLARSLHADHATIEPRQRWRLHDVTVRSFDAADLAAPPHTERVAEMPIAVSAKSDKGLLDERASTLSLADLQHAIAARTREGHDARRFRTLLHERLSDPVTVLLFAWLAIPLGLQVEQRRSLAAPALQGVVLLVVFFFVRNLGTTLSAEGVTPSAVTPWGILSAFAVWGALQVRRSPR